MTEIADKEAEVEQLLGDLNEGTEDREQDDADDREESEETDLAVHLAPLPREDLEELIARLVAWRPELGERVLEIAHKPVDIGAIPYRVEQLTHARASPQEFTAEISPLAKRAHDYALAGDVANARAMAEALTRSVAAAYPTPGIMHECVDSMTKSSSSWLTLFEPYFECAALGAMSSRPPPPPPLVLTLPPPPPPPPHPRLLIRQTMKGR